MMGSDEGDGRQAQFEGDEMMCRRSARADEAMMRILQAGRRRRRDDDQAIGARRIPGSRQGGE